MSGSQPKWKVVKPCVVQATGQRHEPGEYIEVASAFDIAHLQALGAIVPHVDGEYETQAVVPLERRKWGRRAK